MTAAGYLVAEGGQYPVLRVSDSGVAVLQGKQKVYRKAKPCKQHTSYRKTMIYSNVCGLFDGNLVKKQGRTAIRDFFLDKTLRDMCAVMPQNEEEMLTVSGVGESAKLAKYGAAFLKELKADK